MEESNHFLTKNQLEHFIAYYQLAELTTSPNLSHQLIQRRNRFTIGHTIYV